jgi:hypothetical protein
MLHLGTPVNKGKKEGRGVKAPALLHLLDRPYLLCPPGSFPAGFLAGVASFCSRPPLEGMVYAKWHIFVVAWALQVSC